MKLIDFYITEAKKPARESGPWTAEYSPLFLDSLAATKRIFPDIGDKLAKFLEYKLQNPVGSPYGKHDKTMAGGSPLAGFRDCHLRDDAVLIYKLQGRSIFLIKIVSHAEMEGRKQMLLARQLSSYR